MDVDVAAASHRSSGSSAVSNPVRPETLENEGSLPEGKSDDFPREDQSDGFQREGKDSPREKRTAEDILRARARYANLREKFMQSTAEWRPNRDLLKLLENGDVDQHGNAVAFDYCLILESPRRVSGDPMASMRSANYNNDTIRGFVNEIRRYFDRVVVIKPNDLEGKSDKPAYITVLIAATDDDLANVALVDNHFLRFHPTAAFAESYAMHLDLALRFNKEDSVWEDLYGPYSEGCEHLYERYREELRGGRMRRTIFRQVDRLILIESSVKKILSLSDHDGRYKRILREFFPLHDARHVFEIREAVQGVWTLGRENLDQFEHYFGTGVAFYLGFLRLLVRWLFFPAVFGAAVFFYSIATGTLVSVPVFTFVIYMMVHNIFFLRALAQEQSFLALRYGTEQDHRKRESIRHEYSVSGDSAVKVSRVDGSLRSFVPAKAACKKYFVVFMLAFIIVGGLHAMLGVVVYYSHDIPNKIVSGLVDAIGIQGANRICRELAYALTRYENPRTKSLFENHVIGKVTFFKFFTGYGALFYSSIYLYLNGGCDRQSCVEKTAELLIGIFIGMIVLQNVVELLLPYMYPFYSRMVRRCCGDDASVGQAAADLESRERLRMESFSAVSNQVDLQDCEDLLDDYDELVTQYGYMVMFVAFFPMLPCFTLVSCLIECRVDTYKLLNLMRRPKPVSVRSIGSWNHVIYILYLLSIFTNLYVVIFFMDTLDELLPTDEQKMRLYFWGVVFMVGLTLLSIKLMPTHTSAHLEHRERQEYLSPYLIKRKKTDFQKGNLVSVIFEKAFIKEAILKRKGWINNSRIRSMRMRGIDQENRRGGHDLESILDHNSFLTGSHIPALKIKLKIGADQSIQDIHLLNKIVRGDPKNTGPPCLQKLHCGSKESRGIDEMAYDNYSLKPDELNYHIEEIVMWHGFDTPTRFVTDILLRFDSTSVDKDPYLIGVSFNFYGSRPAKRKWYGRDKGGIVLHTNASKRSAEEGTGRYVLAAIKGMNSSNGIIELHCVFVKLKRLDMQEKIQFTRALSVDFDKNFSNMLPVGPDAADARDSKSKVLDDGLVSVVRKRSSEVKEEFKRVKLSIPEMGLDELLELDEKIRNPGKSLLDPNLDKVAKPRRVVPVLNTPSDGIEMKNVIHTAAKISPSSGAIDQQTLINTVYESGSDVDVSDDEEKNERRQPETATSIADTARTAATQSSEVVTATPSETPLLSPSESLRSESNVSLDTSQRSEAPLVSERRRGGGVKLRFLDSQRRRRKAAAARERKTAAAQGSPKPEPGGAVNETGATDSTAGQRKRSSLVVRIGAGQPKKPKQMGSADGIVKSI